jgi:hypothetical protein
MMPATGIEIVKTLLAVALSIFLSACATRPQPTREEIASADYGKFPDAYKDIIKKYMSKKLKDPESARYEFEQEPVKSHYGFSPATYGYAVCVDVNSKNSYGGYSGASTAYFFFRNGVVFDYAMSETRGDFADGRVRDMCLRLL